jgi:hypothetical protein
MGEDKEDEEDLEQVTALDNTKSEFPHLLVARSRALGRR